jgi:MFS-type transporter involved in bile tolerance (Atg22 family)
MFGSLVTIGAMLGAITSGRVTDIIGRKGVCMCNLNALIFFPFKILFLEVTFWIII